MDFSHLVCSYISLFCSPSISDFFNMWGGFHKYFLYLFLEFVVSVFLNFLIEGWCQIINTRSKASNTRNKVSNTRSKASENKSKAFNTRNKVSNTRSKASENKSKAFNTRNKVSETRSKASENRDLCLQDWV